MEDEQEKGEQEREEQENDEQLKSEWSGDIDGVPLALAFLLLILIVFMVWEML